MPESKPPVPDHATALRVLILEDHQSDLELILHELRRAGFDPRHENAATEQEFMSKLDPPPEVILADYSLPQFTARQALRLVRERDMSIPFIIVTGSLSEENAVACIKEGATDYLIKDRLARLGSAIRLALEARQLQEEKRRVDEQIQRSNRELALLNRIITASVESGNESEFLQIACRELREALGAVNATAALLNEDGTEAVIVAESGAPASPTLVGRRISADTHPIVRLVRENLIPFVIEDVQRNPFIQPLWQLIRPSAITSLLIIPLEAGGKSLGGLGLGIGSPQGFTEEQMAFARSVADTLSGALSRARLQSEQRLLGSAIEHTMDGVIMTDAEGRILYVNPGLEAMSGYSLADVVGQPVRMVSRQEPGGEEVNVMPWILETGREWHGRLHNRRKDGSHYVADASIVPVRDSSGDIVRFVSVQRDITGQLEMESRYLQAQKMDAVGRLAGGIAHDFNNLLTVILSYAELMSGDLAPDSQAQELVAEIRGAGNRASQLTRKLLTFSRRQEVQRKPIDVNAVVGDIEKMLRHLLGEDIALHTSLDPRGCHITADPGQIEQAIVNLAVNARDAMPEGGTLTLATESLEDAPADTLPDPSRAPSTPMVMITVTDTGCGMGPEVLAHLFEPFFTTKAEGKGTGLGLATAYGIVKQNEGTVSAESEPGKGTTFRIVFPSTDA